MIYSKQFYQFFYFLIISVCSCNASNTTASLKELKSLNIPNFNIENAGSHYCNCIYREFKRRYIKENLKLTSYLEKLRNWNCSKFEEECEDRYFVFNRYTFLVYEMFCNRSNFWKICSQEISKTLGHGILDSTFTRLRMYSIS